MPRRERSSRSTHHDGHWVPAVRRIPGAARPGRPRGVDKRTPEHGGSARPARRVPECCGHERPLLASPRPTTSTQLPSPSRSRPTTCHTVGRRDRRSRPASSPCRCHTARPRGGLPVRIRGSDAPDAPPTRAARRAMRDAAAVTGSDWDQPQPRSGKTARWLDPQAPVLRQAIDRVNPAAVLPSGP